MYSTKPTAFLNTFPLCANRRSLDLFVPPNQGVLYVRSCYHSLNEHIPLPVSVYIAA